MCESPQQFNDTAFVQGVSIRSCTFVPHFIVMTSFVKDKLYLSCIDFLSIYAIL